MQYNPYATHSRQFLLYVPGHGDSLWKAWQWLTCFLLDSWNTCGCRGLCVLQPAICKFFIASAASNQSSVCRVFFFFFFAQPDWSEKISLSWFCNYKMSNNTICVQTSVTFRRHCATWKELLEVASQEFKNVSCSSFAKWFAYILSIVMLSLWHSHITWVSSGAWMAYFHSWLCPLVLWKRWGLPCACFPEDVDSWVSFQIRCYWQRL